MASRTGSNAMASSSASLPEDDAYRALPHRATLMPANERPPARCLMRARPHRARAPQGRQARRRAPVVSIVKSTTREPGTTAGHACRTSPSALSRRRQRPRLAAVAGTRISPPDGDPAKTISRSIHVPPRIDGASASVTGAPPATRDFLQPSVGKEPDPAAIGREERRSTILGAGNGRRLEPVERPDVDAAAGRRRRPTRRAGMPSAENASAGAEASNAVPAAEVHGESGGRWLARCDRCASIATPPPRR